MKESVIENYLVERMREIGGDSVKFTSSGVSHLPDRICFFDEGVIALVECKSPTGKKRRGQRSMIKWFKNKGYVAVFINSRPKVDAFIRIMLKRVERQKQWRLEHELGQDI